MIKLKSLIIEEKTKINKLVSNWKNKKAQDYASKLIEKNLDTSDNRKLVSDAIDKVGQA